MTHEAFDVRWLSMREPTDHVSRALALLPLLKVAWRAGKWSRVLDLGAGTGSNLRYLAPKLPSGQRWTLVDHAPELLARAVSPSSRVERLDHVCGDLAGEGIAAVAHADLVTGSALLDLVSRDWLGALVEACCSVRGAMLFAMTYDGRIEWDAQGTTELDDELVRGLVNGHQRRNKGLGEALGPTAAVVLDALVRRAGYRAWFLPSPWHLSGPHADLARALVDGWARAASDQDPRCRAEVQAWADRRRELIAGGRFGLTVGHVDMLALPPESG